MRTMAVDTFRGGGGGVRIMLSKVVALSDQATSREPQNSTPQVIAPQLALLAVGSVTCLEASRALDDSRDELLRVLLPSV